MALQGLAAPILTVFKVTKSGKPLHICLLFMQFFKSKVLKSDVSFVFYFQKYTSY